MIQPAAKAGDRLELTLDEEARVTMAFRYIPACPEGFLMGARDGKISEWLVHRVRLSEGFWLGETLVTQAQFGVWTSSEAYTDWLAENREKLFSPYRDPHQNRFAQDASVQLPAGSISWYEARAFCECLDKQQVTTDAGTAGLPSEAQWEYACRAGTDTEYWSGDGEAALAEVAWYDGNSERKSQPVKTKPANPWGLYDMHGNLWEWCQDVWKGTAYAGRPIDEESPVEKLQGEETEQSIRVLRGGSWVNSAGLCRSANRSGFGTGSRAGSRGFRVGLFPGP